MRINNNFKQEISYLEQDINPDLPEIQPVMLTNTPPTSFWRSKLEFLLFVCVQMTAFPIQMDQAIK